MGNKVDLKVCKMVPYRNSTIESDLKIAKRRNRWMCALKTALAEVKIYGPKGNPRAPLPVTRYVNVPWDQVQTVEREIDKEHVAFAFPMPTAVH